MRPLWTLQKNRSTLPLRTLQKIQTSRPFCTLPKLQTTLPFQTLQEYRILQRYPFKLFKKCNNATHSDSSINTNYTTPKKNKKSFLSKILGVGTRFSDDVSGQIGCEYAVVVKRDERGRERCFWTPKEDDKKTPEKAAKKALRDKKRKS